MSNLYNNDKIKVVKNQCTKGIGTMEESSFEDIESKYSELAELNNSKKSTVYLVQNVLDGRIYIKKELKNYNIDVYRQIIKIKNMFMARIYEIFKCEDSLIVIEEFVNGQTLQSMVDNKGPLKEETAIKYMINLCSILDVLHNLNPAVIHRDIKPSNIIIDNNGILKLIDFDVSRVYKKAGNMDTHILGTKGYASPEQFGFDQTDCRSDIYSIGVMLNVLTTGKHIKEKLNEGKLKVIIEKCTNISPDNRYSNVNELKLVLENALKENRIGNVNKEYIINPVKKEPKENNIDLLNLKKEYINNSQEYKSSYDNSNKQYTYSNKLDSDSVKADEKEKNVFKKILSKVKELPGYRTKNPLIILVASIWYFFLVFGFCCNWGTGNISLMLEDAVMASILLIFTLFNGNYKNIKSKLPLTNRNEIGSKIVGHIIYNFLLFVALGFLLELV